jgi:hypothetical protein
MRRRDRGALLSKHVWFGRRERRFGRCFGNVELVVERWCVGERWLFSRTRLAVEHGWFVAVVGHWRFVTVAGHAGLWRLVLVNGRQLARNRRFAGFGRQGPGRRRSVGNGRVRDGGHVVRSHG